MKPYLDLLRATRGGGARQRNRTGIDTLMIPGCMMQFDLADGFPILTTKAVNFKSVAAELVGFVRGYDNADAFAELGTKIWNANANENRAWLENPNRRGAGDLGRVYGVQWRRWRSPRDVPGGPDADGRGWTDSGTKVEEIDQLRRALDTLMRDPTSRRNIVTAWNPGELDRMALPPCHLIYQFIVGQEKNKLHMTMYMRSCDMFLGVPFNISSYALLLSIVAYAVRMNPGKLTMFLADCHVYVNHLEQVDEQLSREPRNLPGLLIAAPFRTDDVEPIAWLEAFRPVEAVLVDYRPHPPIRAEMAL